MNHDSLEKYILSLKGSKLSYPFGKDMAVYSVSDEMFAIVEKGKLPIRLSLRCDKLLADTLKERYEEVMPGHKLNKDKWITLVMSGQLKDPEIKDLIIHSYNLVKDEAKT